MAKDNRQDDDRRGARKRRAAGMRRFYPPMQGQSNFAGSTDTGLLFSEVMNNVRPIDVQDKKLRMGQRPGLDKWGNGVQIGGVDAPVVAICSVSTIK